MIYLTNLLARILYNSMFEQKYTQYTMLFYAFLILQAYMLFRVWRNRCIYKYIPWEDVDLIFRVFCLEQVNV